MSCPRAARAAHDAWLGSLTGPRYLPEPAQPGPKLQAGYPG